MAVLAETSIPRENSAAATLLATLPGKSLVKSRADAAICIRAGRGFLNEDRPIAAAAVVLNRLTGEGGSHAVWNGFARPAQVLELLGDTLGRVDKILHDTGKGQLYYQRALALRAVGEPAGAAKDALFAADKHFSTGPYPMGRALVACELATLDLERNSPGELPALEMAYHGAQSAHTYLEIAQQTPAGPTFDNLYHKDVPSLLIFAQALRDVVASDWHDKDSKNRIDGIHSRLRSVQSLTGGPVTGRALYHLTRSAQEYANRMEDLGEAQLRLAPLVGQIDAALRLKSEASHYENAFTYAALGIVLCKLGHRDGSHTAFGEAVNYAVCSGDIEILTQIQRDCRICDRS